jgi:hypothetical protein
MMVNIWWNVHVGVCGGCWEGVMICSALRIAGRWVVRRALVVVVAAVLVSAWLAGYGLAGDAPVPAGPVLATGGTIIVEN